MSKSSHRHSQAFAGTILLILQDIRASCSPIDARLSYVNDVCYFGGINIQVSWFLKLYSNLRPADKFRGLSFVDNCTRLTIASDPNPNIVRSIRENNLTASLVVDTNPYIAYFETPQFRITYNYILGGIYFALGKTRSTCIKELIPLYSFFSFLRSADILLAYLQVYDYKDLYCDPFREHGDLQLSRRSSSVRGTLY